MITHLCYHFSMYLPTFKLFAPSANLQINSCIQGSQKKSNSGFTLLELMIVIAIVAALSGFAIPNFNTYISNQNIRQAQDQIKSDIRSIQVRALNGVTDSALSNPATYWGMAFAAGQSRYVYLVTDVSPSALSGLCSTASNPSNWSNYERSDSLPAGIQVQDTTCFFFSLENGDASCEVGSGMIHVDYPGGSRDERIEINRSGVVYTYSGSDPDPIPTGEECP